MAITKSLSDDGKTLSIAVSGRFDFAAHQEFRDAYERAALKPSRYVVDLHEAAYIDSSALGMLLLLRDYAGGDSADIRIVRCNPDVRKVLGISNFGQLFVIE
ncbi:MAG: STAS domain-containing protein [Halopseudomonas yangmingensis]|uniref:Anti-anti-sigma factor n=1 Tax=Halopseudomonas yangmingensis TaxID=1720063 RepID=A0A1I4N8T2_9GAMM|nr:STAS domain-containing protein [Halopseudomonas yangmingensis]SFM11964.1 anti-anti-sigma factor [Halopseudomonas yangmingensis]